MKLKSVISENRIDLKSLLSMNWIPADKMDYDDAYGGGTDPDTKTAMMTTTGDEIVYASVYCLDGHWVAQIEDMMGLPYKQKVKDLKAGLMVLKKLTGVKPKEGWDYETNKSIKV